MYRLLPILFALALVPESEKKIETINAFILATKDSVMSIKNGMDNFHATMKPFMMAQAGTESGKTSSFSSSGGGESK